VRLINAFIEQREREEKEREERRERERERERELRTVGMYSPGKALVV